MGRALTNSRRQESRRRRAANRASKSSAPAEISVTELSSLDDFLAQAQLSSRTFEAERRSNVVVLDSRESKPPPPKFNPKSLPIPRRPHWDSCTTPSELASREASSFLEWRRGIAKLEEDNPHLKATPFEKNLEYWRQLWRVVERSDVLVQVVDARNPLLYRSIDLEDYVAGMGKKNVILLNKADLLTPRERSAWQAWFDGNVDAHCIWFSAKESQAEIDSGAASSRRASLLEELTNMSERTIGLVGYPNVGKSSVVNVLLGATKNDHQAQRVSVAATPGHTKHFQTLQLPDKVHVLCDCPGLVFPSFLSTKAEMILAGVLPVDQSREADNVAACEHMCARVPKAVFEMTYGLKLGGRLRARRLLEAFCTMKGFMASAHGGVDSSRGARILIKDFISGKIRYCEPAPVLVVGDSDGDGGGASLVVDEAELELEMLVEEENEAVAGRKIDDKKADEKKRAPRIKTGKSRKGKKKKGVRRQVDPYASGVPTVHMKVPPSFRR